MKQSETQSRRTCKLPPLTRRQKILRNLILILLAVCVLALRPQSEYVRTSDAALDRALNKQLGMLQPYEIIADYELPDDMDFFHREVYVRTSVQDKPQIAIVRIQKHEDGRYSPYFDPQIVSEEEMNSDTPLGFLGLWGKQPEAEQGIYHMTCPENFPQLGTDADVKFEPDCGDGRVRVAIDRWRVGDKPDDPKEVEALYGIKLKQGEESGDYFTDFDADLVYAADLSQGVNAAEPIVWEYIRPGFEPGGYTEEGLVLSDADALRLAKMLNNALKTARTEEYPISVKSRDPESLALDWE